MICRTHTVNYTNVERYSNSLTVEGYSNWLETDSEAGRCKRVGDFLSTS